MSDIAYKNLTFEVRLRTAWITINRPERLNALNRETVQEISHAVLRAVADPEVRVLVLRGAGPKAFVAGADIREMSSLGATEAWEFSRLLQETFDRIERSPKPVLAAINGFALGGGCELALACHLRIAADTAKLGQPEVSLGLIPGAGGTQRLPRLVGRGRALELILLGEPLDAREAERLGLVNKVVPAGDLEQEVTSWAERLAARSPKALALCLEAVRTGADVGLDEALRLEAALFGLCFSTEDMREGTQAFLEKRSPTFSGR